MPRDRLRDRDIYRYNESYRDRDTDSVRDKAECTYIVLLVLARIARKAVRQ